MTKTENEAVRLKNEILGGGDAKVLGEKLNLKDLEAAISFFEKFSDR